VIFRIAPREEWERSRQDGAYRADTLETEGFIHCSTHEQLVWVANMFFRGQRGLVLLCIDPSRLRVEVRYEDTEGGEQFPHIYGPLHVEAVVRVLEFEPGEDGEFELPEGVP